MWIWKKRRRIYFDFQNAILFLIFVVLPQNLFLANGFLFDGGGCLNGCCGRNCGCDLGINNLCCNLGCCLLGGCCPCCGTECVSLFNVALPLGSLPSPRLPLPPPLPPPVFQAPPIGSLSALASLLCAPPCGCGGCSSPPLMFSPPSPSSPPVAPIVPVPLILQPPQPLQSPPQLPNLPLPFHSSLCAPQERLCTIPVMQCLMPCRSPSCQQKKNCNDCWSDISNMDDMDEFDDYRKRRKRQNQMSDLRNNLQYKCMKLINQKRNSYIKNGRPNQLCNTPCTIEQELRCRSKQMILEIICRKMQNRLLFEELFDN